MRSSERSEGGIFLPGPLDLIGITQQKKPNGVVERGKSTSPLSLRGVVKKLSTIEDDGSKIKGDKEATVGQSFGEVSETEMPFNEEGGVGGDGATLADIDLDNVIIPAK